MRILGGLLWMGTWWTLRRWTNWPAAATGVILAILGIATESETGVEMAGPRAKLARHLRNIFPDL